MMRKNRSNEKKGTSYDWVTVKLEQIANEQRLIDIDLGPEDTTGNNKFFAEAYADMQNDYLTEIKKTSKDANKKEIHKQFLNATVFAQLLKKENVFETRLTPTELYNTARKISAYDNTLKLSELLISDIDRDGNADATVNKTVIDQFRKLIKNIDVKKIINAPDNYQLIVWKKVLR